MATGSSGSRRAPRAKGAPAPELSVLRIGHRPGRDPRLTTHVALVARAFGARRMFLEPPDPGVEERIRAVGRRWGGAFEVVGVDRWQPVVDRFDGAVVHLTMYGLPLDRVRGRLMRHRRLLLVVGGAKVPPDLYRRSDYNVAVGSQPHSEVAAVALALDRLRGASRPRFPGAAAAIVPQARGKRVRAPGRGPS